jgi:YegS/Rv2252/BmrU family lipid kinase
MNETIARILFVINQGSGSRKRIDWNGVIRSYFAYLPYEIDFFLLPCDEAAAKLKKKIADWKPYRVVAVGGDGTAAMVAHELRGTDMQMGIVPAGSANGMAKELDIPEDASLALGIIVTGNSKKADLIEINDQHICLHLSDVGLNAQLVKYFQEGSVRGKIGYVRALIKALFRKQRMRVSVVFQDKEMQYSAVMVLIANASKYGTGATINPLGNIYDGIFEVVVVRRLGLLHILKMFLKYQRFNPKEIQVLQATAVNIETTHRVHFQIDGEYLGKLKTVKARILAAQLNLLIPAVV